MRGITFGVWDLFHYGHLRFLEKARRQVDMLIVGVCGDDMTERTKHTRPVIDQWRRVKIIEALKCVDGTFIYIHPNYIDHARINGANVLIVGEDFGNQGVEEQKQALDDMPYIRLERTRGISSTNIKNTIKERACYV